jgi:hypothetical protein
MLDRSYTLPEENQQRFLRACFWLQHARIVHSHSRSASYTALICAVEALIPPQRGAPICSECNRSKGKGPTGLFKEFVDRYAPPGGDSQVNRGKFYEIRSKLSHEGRLLATDREGLWRCIPQGERAAGRRSRAGAWGTAPPRSGYTRRLAHGP